MSDKLKLILTDTFTISLSWTSYYIFCVQGGWLTYSADPEFMMPMLVICFFWLTVFFLFGLYRSWYTKSRIDEFIALLKATTFGTLTLFFAIFIDDNGVGSPTHTRLLIVIYWGLMILHVGGGRLLIHSFQRRLLEVGVGRRNAVIIGMNERAFELFEMVSQHRGLGYDVIGFVPTEKHGNSTITPPVPILGSITELPSILDSYSVEDVLIALDSSEHDKLLEIIGSCNGHDVSMKIMPDMYDIISGQARTNQIYGFPLIEVMPELMPPWEHAVKRALDFTVALVVVVIGFPLWVLVAIAIKFDSKGPIFYKQDRVGRDGKVFKMVKFRSMDELAEAESGPVWANKRDPRITRVGKWLRKLRLDEIPQLLNILEGDMSLVGPRPERPFFVEKFTREVPLYNRRLKVRPGLTGWAQVKHKYDETIDDVKKKVQYDLFYIENMSLRMDFKIILRTIAVVLRGKGQ